jgi:hypothetical protein
VVSAKPAPTPEERDRVLECIQEGCGTRQGIVAATGFCDRVIRECVHALVLAGHPIVSDRRGGGYHFAGTPEEIEAEAKVLGSHAARIRERAEALERHLGPMQARLFA